MDGEEQEEEEECYLEVLLRQWRESEEEEEMTRVVLFVALPARVSISISETVSCSGCIPLVGVWLKESSTESFRPSPDPPACTDGFRRGSMSSSN